MTTWLNPDKFAIYDEKRARDLFDRLCRSRLSVGRDMDERVLPSTSLPPSNQVEVEVDGAFLAVSKDSTNSNPEWEVRENDPDAFDGKISSWYKRNGDWSKTSLRLEHVSPSWKSDLTIKCEFGSFPPEAIMMLKRPDVSCQHLFDLFDRFPGDLKNEILQSWL